MKYGARPIGHVGRQSEENIDIEVDRPQKA